MLPCRRRPISTLDPLVQVQVIAEVDAHRLAVANNADQVVFLEGGRIAEQGRHGDLAARGGGRARPWEPVAAQT